MSIAKIQSILACKSIREFIVAYPVYSIFSFIGLYRIMKIIFFLINKQYTKRFRPRRNFNIRYGKSNCFAVIFDSQSPAWIAYSKKLASMGFNLFLVSSKFTEINQIKKELEDTNIRILYYLFTEENSDNYLDLIEHLANIDVGIIVYIESEITYSIFNILSLIKNCCLRMQGRQFKSAFIFLSELNQESCKNIYYLSYLNFKKTLVRSLKSEFGSKIDFITLSYISKDFSRNQLNDEINT